MNHSNIAAALHALADAFLEGVEVVEDKVTGKATKSKTSKAAPAAETVVGIAAAEQPTAVLTAAAPVATTPAVPSITKDQLNKAVLAVAAKSRDKAEEVLAKFGAKNTVTLPEAQWQAVFDAFEEALAQIDAAAVQVQQASLV